MEVLHDADVTSMSINPEEGFLTQTTEGSGNYSMEAIIVVAPSAGSNVITMYNVEQFMDKGEYVSSEMMRKVITHSPFHCRNRH